MTDPANTLKAPWSLDIDRDGTEDIAIITDATGEPLATSRPFWLPEGDDPVPPTLASMRAMAAAPELLEALRIVVEMEYDRDEESRNFDEERLLYFSDIIAKASRRAA